MESILKEQRLLSAAAGAAPVTSPRHNSFDEGDGGGDIADADCASHRAAGGDSPAPCLDSPAHGQRAALPAPAAAPADDWDNDSEGEDDSGEGLIQVTKPCGQRRRYHTLVSALQSSSLPSGSTIRLPAGTHQWPGGDLHHSIAGAGAGGCVIEGNAGGGYFFYLRRNGLRVCDVTLRGVHGGRSFWYVDQLSDVELRRCHVEGERYNHCIQVIGSSDILIEGCSLAGAQQPSIEVSGSRNVRVARNAIRCTQSPAVSFSESAGEVCRNSFAGSGGGLRLNSSPAVDEFENTVGQ